MILLGIEIILVGVICGSIIMYIIMDKNRDMGGDIIADSIGSGIYIVVGVLIGRYYFINKSTLFSLITLVLAIVITTILSTLIEFHRLDRKNKLK